MFPFREVVVPLDWAAASDDVIWEHVHLIKHATRSKSSFSISFTPQWKHQCHTNVHIIYSFNCKLANWIQFQKRNSTELSPLPNNLIYVTSFSCFFFLLKNFIFQWLNSQLELELKKFITANGTQIRNS